MKKLQILLPLAAVLLSLTGCKKDNEKSGPSGETVTFTANIGGGEKTEIYDGTKMKWSKGDAITINGDLFTSDFPMDDYTTANFVGNFTTPPNDYHAYYPETLYKEDGGKYVLPATQEYNGSTLSGINPMYAYQPNVDNKTLQFHNICALVKLEVTGTGTVKQIVVTSTDNLCGTFTVSGDGGKYHAVISEGEKSVTLNCGTGVTLNETTSTTFYIALPQGELGDLTFKCSGDAGVWTSQPIASADLTAGKLYTKSLENVVVPQPVIEFTVGMDNDTPRKVKFAPGNLWYDGSAFKFETNQWDTDPTAVNQTGSSDTWNSSHVSHFLWSPDKDVAVGTSTLVSGATSDVFFTNATETTANPDFEVSGETAGTWRTLSKGEWSYLLNTSGSSGRTDANRFAKAKVNGVCGLLIFPDGYNGGVAIGDITGVATLNTTDAAYPGDNIPEDTWSSMESSGAVFLPAAGYRIGMNVYSVGSTGRYWSGTTNESIGGSGVSFNSGNVSTIYAGNRGYGHAVRLVR